MEYEKRSRAKRRIIIAVLIIAAVFIAAGLTAGFWSAGEMREQVVRQFNEEQLVIAHSASNLIERELDFLKREILLLGENLTKEDLDPEKQNVMIQISLSRVLTRGVFSIDILDVKKRERDIYMPYKHFSMEEGPETDLPEMNSAGPVNLESVWISRPRIKPSGMTISMAVALSDDLSRVLLFDVNLSWFLKPLLKDMRSGKTGYVWLIDEQGIFLFHPDADFPGKNAFRVREERDPEISYGLINSIQEEKMIKGLEGTGYYYSGWHRGITGKVKKLIAFCPVMISDNPRQIWSVAVVAPVSEIEEALRTGNRRLFLLQSLMIVAVILGASFIIFLEKRWSKNLEKKVIKRTRELKKSQENYRSLVESAEDFIFTADDRGVLLSMNSFTANFFGGTTGDFLGKDLSVLFPQGVVKKQLRLIGLVYKLGKSVRDEFELQMGEVQIWINANFMPLRDEEGNVNAVLCIARDITETKNLERQMINTEKLASIGTLAAGVAHEINNPLGVILGFCDLLLRNTDKESQQFEDLKTIERQGLHCKQVVENLLSFARLNGGDREYSDLKECLEEIIKVVRHTLEMKEIDLVLDLDKRAIWVAGDPGELKQVFLNLINNAGSSMEKGGGRLTISTRLDRGGRKAVVRIQDEGTGIKKEDMDHIFEPFFTTKQEGEGTGLGLFISYGIIKKYGGTIDCMSHTEDSSSMKMGTVFTIKLPTKRE